LNDAAIEAGNTKLAKENKELTSDRELLLEN